MYKKLPIKLEKKLGIVIKNRPDVLTGVLVFKVDRFDYRLSCAEDKISSAYCQQKKRINDDYIECLSLIPHLGLNFFSVMM